MLCIPHAYIQLVCEWTPCFIQHVKHQSRRLGGRCSMFRVTLNILKLSIIEDCVLAVLYSAFMEISSHDSELVAGFDLPLFWARERPGLLILTVWSYCYGCHHSWSVHAGQTPVSKFVVILCTQTDFNVLTSPLSIVFQRLPS